MSRRFLFIIDMILNAIGVLTWIKSPGFRKDLILVLATAILIALIGGFALAIPIIRAQMREPWHG